MRKSASAATIAARCADAVFRGDTDRAIKSALEVMDYALIAGSNLEAVAASMALDFSAIAARWPANLGSMEPIDFDLLGDLWSDGTPEGWPRGHCLYDAFISYASEDRKTVANPLYRGLRLRHHVWYAPVKLAPGDLLYLSLDEAIARSRVLLVVLSPDSLQKYWTKLELGGIIALCAATPGRRLVLILHRISHDELSRRRPMLAGMLSITHVAPRNTLRQLRNLLDLPLRHE